MNSPLLSQDAPDTAAWPPHKRREIYYPESDGKPMAETDLHRDQMNDLIGALQRHYANAPDIYVTGNIMFYYEEGNRYKFISPDVMVVKGVPKHRRRVFKLWEERPPRVVLEISSRGTKREDFETKLELYAQFGVPEYYISDPERKNAARSFTAFRLEDGQYERVSIVNDCIFSPELDLELVKTNGLLRLRDPATGRLLLTADEEAAARQEAEAAWREAAAARAAAEAARWRVEAENARLLAELERLRGGRS